MELEGVSLYGKRGDMLFVTIYEVIRPRTGGRRRYLSLDMHVDYAYWLRMSGEEDDIALRVSTEQVIVRDALCWIDDGVRQELAGSRRFRSESECGWQTVTRADIHRMIGGGRVDGDGGGQCGAFCGQVRRWQEGDVHTDVDNGVYERRAVDYERLVEDCSLDKLQRLNSILAGRRLLFTEVRQLAVHIGLITRDQEESVARMLQLLLLNGGIRLAAGMELDEERVVAGKLGHWIGRWKRERRRASAEGRSDRRWIAVASWRQWLRNVYRKGHAVDRAPSSSCSEADKRKRHDASKRNDATKRQRCGRCNSGVDKHFKTHCAVCGRECAYCEACLQMGRVRECSLFVVGDRKEAVDNVSGVIGGSGPVDKGLNVIGGLKGAGSRSGVLEGSRDEDNGTGVLGGSRDGDNGTGVLEGSRDGDNGTGVLGGSRDGDNRSGVREGSRDGDNGTGVLGGSRDVDNGTGVLEGSRDVDNGTGVLGGSRDGDYGTGVLEGSRDVHNKSGAPRESVDMEELLKRWSLSPAQEAASREAMTFVSTPSVREGEQFLIWAVTGAGKTEMVYPLVAYMLMRGGRVLLTAPRRDVVLELAPRLAKAFAGREVVALYGGSEERWEIGEITVATTHQLLRLERCFDLVVLDELDAYPYHHNPMLAHAVRRACKARGKTLLLTATPPREQQLALRQRRLPHAMVPVRFHRHPLPEPRILRYRGLRALLGAGRLPSQLRAALDESLQRGAQLFVFVPRIEHVEPLTRLLRRACAGAVDASRVDGTSSRDADRANRVRRFRSGELRILVTTTILERGVTIPRSDVFVLDADAALFDEAALVQMAGRAGRSADDPRGRVYFVARERTDGQLQAVRHIRAMNTLARKRGLLLQGSAAASGGGESDA